MCNRKVRGTAAEAAILDDLGSPNPNTKSLRFTSKDAEGTPRTLNNQALRPKPLPGYYIVLHYASLHDLLNLL